MPELRFLPAAGKYFKKLKEKGLKEKFNKAIQNILENPFIGEAKHGDLEGIYCLDVFYNKTNYELAYVIYQEENQVIVVIMAGTRENFYENLKRYRK